MPNLSQTSEVDATEPIPAATLQSQVAARIRADSATLARPTLAGSLAPFFVGMSTDETRSAITLLLADEQYRDIKLLSLPDAVYFYSERHITPEGAKSAGLLEAAKARIVERVRAESADPAQLTPLAALAPLVSDLDMGDVGAMVGQLLADERYADIESIATAAGEAFLFSTQHMTRNYATILARVEAADPAAAIVDTVRDESRIYPRPTNIGLFLQPPFNLDLDTLMAVIERLPEQEAYADIERIEASTGTVYLFSSRHMHRAAAKKKVEWEEVGRFLNP